MQKTAIVIGATGLVGKQLLKQLASLYDKVIVIARRPPSYINEAMRVYQLSDFANLAETINSLNLDETVDAFSCLGTTKKQAGSEDGFRLVDYQYNLQFAQLCHQQGVKQFFLLSAMNADKNSRFFYNQVKGELEEDIKKIGFESCYIFRPSLLLGKHKGRPMEAFSQRAFKLISPIVSERLNAHPISAKRVAIAMAMMAHQAYQNYRYRQHGSKHEVIIIENKKMLAMTKKTS